MGIKTLFANSVLFALTYSILVAILLFKYQFLGFPFFYMISGGCQNSKLRILCQVFGIVTALLKHIISVLFFSEMMLI